MLYKLTSYVESISVRAKNYHEEETHNGGIEQPLVEPSFLRLLEILSVI